MENNTSKQADDNKQSEQEQNEKKGSGTAAQIDSIIGSPTERVKGKMPSSDELGKTGTNVSYEGATSTAAGGTGENSGQPATGAKMTTSSEYEDGRAEREQETDDEADDVKSKGI